jgi:hypothetical protein
VRIDDGCRLREDGRRPVMIRDQDIDAANRGGGDLGRARNAAVDGDDDGPALGVTAVDRRDRKSMPLPRAVGHVGRGIQPEPAQRADEDGQAGQSVGIEVTEDHHALAAGHRGADPRAERFGARQQQRVVQATDGIAEELRQRVRIGVPAGRQNAEEGTRESPCRAGLEEARSKLGSVREDPAEARRRLGHRSGV